MKILKLALCLTLIATLFFSCTKENLKQFDFKNESLKEIITELNKVESSEVEEYFDDIVFHTGLAFQNLTITDVSLKQRLLNDLPKNKLSLKEFLKFNENIKSNLNQEIRKSLMTNNVYDNHMDERVRNELSKNKNFDFIELYNLIIAEQSKDEELILFMPDNVMEKVDNSNLLIGLETALPNKDLAIIFKDNNVITITEEEANKIKNPIVFIGVNRIQKLNASKRLSSDQNQFTQTLKKWWHHGKVTRQACSNLECDVDYEWHKKRRWHTSWKFAESGTLSYTNDSSIFYHSEYRIKIQVLWLGLSNFELHQKHWSGNSWQVINI